MYCLLIMVLFMKAKAFFNLKKNTDYVLAIGSESAKHRKSDLFECLLDIGQNIIRMFDPH